MKKIYKFLKNHKAKHNLEYRLKLEDRNGDLSVDFTIFGNDWTNFITIYSFHSDETKKKKIDKIRKLLNNKRKALEFIGYRPLADVEINKG